MSEHESRFAWLSRPTRYQWGVLVVAGLGWMFDTMDVTLYVLVQRPALKELLGAEGTPERIAFVNGIILALSLLGWALGGVVFGVVADYIGRARTMALTILLYALVTGLSALARTWPELAAMRFVTGLGLGGEWAAGAAIIAEVWPDDLRAKAGALLQTMGPLGFFVSGLINTIIGAHSWRQVFVIGALPAFLLLIIRRFVKEPDTWVRTHEEEKLEKAQGKKYSPMAQLFSPAHRRDTLISSAIAAVSLIVLFGATMWIPGVMRDLTLPTLGDLEPPMRERALAQAAGKGAMLLNAGAIIGCAAAAFFADRWGRKKALLFYLAGGLVAFPLAFIYASSLDTVKLFLPMVGFFSLGVTAVFPIYLPELYPTRMRATGSGFCFNAGRVLTAPFVIGAGSLVGMTGSTGKAIVYVSMAYVVGMLLVPFARETKGAALAETD